MTVTEKWVQKRAYSKQTFSKIVYRNTIRMSNSSDPNKDQRSVSPDLGPNCLQRVLYSSRKVATSKERVNSQCSLKQTDQKLIREHVWIQEFCQGGGGGSNDFIAEKTFLSQGSRGV